VHPSSADLVVAPTGGGLYRSDNGGRTWRLLYECYCRAVWLDPDDADHMVFGPADGVSENGRIEMTCDGGKTWQSADRGLDSPWPHQMVERFLQLGDELIATVSDGRLIASSSGTVHWRALLSEIGDARAVAAARVSSKE
jgi:hypothetical protein